MTRSHGRALGLHLGLGVGLAAGLIGCFDSLVNDHCASGFGKTDGRCVSLIADAGGDAVGPGGSVCPAPTQACGDTCLDTTADPDSCGGCGHVCASGVCSNSVCGGTLRGHIVAIGHDYRSSHPSMARVLGDAVSLGAHYDVGVGRWHGTSDTTAVSGTTSAIMSAMREIGRPWHFRALPNGPQPSAFDGVDVLLVDAQTGDGDAAQTAGATWNSVIGSFVARGGVVVVLEGTAGVSYRMAQGAGLFTVDPPVDTTGQLATVVDSEDATTQQVVSPYLAETTSVTFPSAPSAAITTPDGTVVFHLTR